MERYIFNFDFFNKKKMSQGRFSKISIVYTNILIVKYIFINSTQ